MIIVPEQGAPFVAPLTERERHKAEIEITEYPVESGASYSDHSYRRPDEATIHISTLSPRFSWQRLRAILRARRPVTLVSGLDVQRNMMLRAQEVDLDAMTVNLPTIALHLREVRIAESRTVRVSGGAPAAPGDGGLAQSGLESRTSAGGGGNRAAQPSRSTAGDATTADRAAAPVSTGDSPTAPATQPPVSAGPPRSVLKDIFEPEGLVIGP